MMSIFPTFPESNIARGVYVDQEATKFSSSLTDLPRRLLILGSPTTDAVVDNVPKLFTSAEKASAYGEGSQLYNMLAYALDYGSAVETYVLPIVCESGTAATAEIAFSGTATSTGTLYFYIDGIAMSFSVSSGDSGAEIVTSMLSAISSNIYLPCTAAVKDDDDTVIVLTAKWKGETSNDIKIIQNYYDSDSDSMPSGIVVSNTGFIGGAGIVDIASCLDNWGDTWFTMVATAFRDGTNLKSLCNYADDLIGALEMRPFTVVAGSNDNREDYIDFVSGLNYKHLVVMPAEESPTPNYLIASSAAMFIEDSHVTHSAAAYSGVLRNVLAGQNLKSTNQATKSSIMYNGGCTTFSNADNTVSVENTVSTYTKKDNGIADDSWRYPQVMACYQYIVYSLHLIFNSSPFIGAVLVSESTVTNNSKAVKPSRAKASVSELIQLLGLAAIIKDPDFSTSNLEVYIDEKYPTRLVVKLPLYWALPLEQCVTMVYWSVSA